MIYVYFSIKCVVRWSENSVRFDNLTGIGFQMDQILSHIVRYGMYGGDSAALKFRREPNIRQSIDKIQQKLQKIWTSKNLNQKF